MHQFELIYRFPYFNGYGKEYAYKRFCVLHNLFFESVLDVGSGPCYLKKWLVKNKINCEYEAMDIRKDSLNLCECKTYTNIPKNNLYDLVCLFGTITYNINNNEKENKKILYDLLKESLDVCKKYLVFTVFKEEKRDSKNSFVCYSKNEISKLLSDLNMLKYELIDDSDIDKDEYIILCHV